MVEAGPVLPPAQHLLHLSRRGQEQGECQHLHDVINQLCDIQGSWLFSPKALRMTQNGSQTNCFSVWVLVFYTLCSMSKWNTWSIMKHLFTHIVLIEISHDVLQYSVLYSEWENENARSPPLIWAWPECSASAWACSCTGCGRACTRCRPGSSPSGRCRGWARRRGPALTLSGQSCPASQSEN